MADNRDLRIRAFCYIKDEVKARGLFDHIQDLLVEAVDINPGTPNAELRKVTIGGNWIVEYDLSFPPNKHGIARGLYNHTINLPLAKLPTSGPDDETGFVTLERCGHRIGKPCKVTKKFKVGS